MPQLQTKKEDRPTVEQIKAAYKAGVITKMDQVEKTRLLAKMNLEDIIENQGMLLTYFTQTAKHIQTHWDDFVEEAKKASGDPLSLKNLKTVGALLYDEVGMAVAPFAAFAEVNGATMRRWAQDAGLSPGLSAFFGTLANVGSNFVPVGKVAQLFAKGVQAGAPVVAKAVSKISGAGKAGEAAKAAEATAAAEKLANEAIVKGLKAEGVELTGLEGFVKDADELQVVPDFIESFNESLLRYHAEIKKVTEVVHIKDLEKEAAKLGLTVDDLRSIGKNAQMAPSQILAYLRALEEPIQKWADLALNVQQGNTAAHLAFNNMSRDMMSLVPTFRRSQHVSGLAVRVQDTDPRMKSISEMLRAWSPEDIAKLDFDAATRLMAEDVVALGNNMNSVKLFKLKADQLAETVTEPGTLWQKVKEAYSGLYLLRPVTWTRTFIGNAVANGVNLTERQLAGWLSLDEAKGIVKGEGWAAYKGQQAAIAEAFSAFGDAFKHNAAAQTTRFDFPIHQIGGGFGRVINLGHDNVMGFDAMFKTLHRNSEIWAAAHRAAVQQGLEPGTKAFTDYVISRRTMPTAETTSAAESIASALTFQAELGEWGKAVQKFFQYGPLYLYNPFMKSPINLMKWAWNRTPGLQFVSKSLYEDILAGGTRADMAVARLTLSNILGNFWFGMAQEGMLTAGGPWDPNLRRGWLATHQPYSLNTGNGFISIRNAAEPGTTPLEMIADFAEIRNQLDDPTAEQTWSAIMLTLSRDVLDKSWWRTNSQLFEIGQAAKGGEETGAMGTRLVFGPVIGPGTLGPLGQAVEGNIDPVRRETRSWIDAIKNGLGARVMGFSKDMPPVRDGYGDPIVIPQALGSEWLRKNMAIGGDMFAGLNNLGNPFVYSPNETDKIKQEGSRLQVKIPSFPWSLGGKVNDEFDLHMALPGDTMPTQLTPQQRDRWQVIYRNVLRNQELGIDTVLNSDEYKNGTVAAQRTMFTAAMAQARSAAKDMLLTEDVGLAKKAISNTAGKYLPLLQESERPEVQGAIDEAVKSLDDMLTPEARDNLYRWGVMDTGDERDKQIIEERRPGGVRMEINKPLADLNAAARTEARP